ncbi:MAG TPA: hypothetical protein VIM02_08670 [Rhizomicrobium sp.]
MTTVVQAWLARKSEIANRDFQEKKEAYVGFLEALHRSEVEQTGEASKRAGHWQNRCELVGSNTVRDLIQRVIETNPSAGKAHPDRPQVISDLKAAMRSDLGIQN